MVNHYKKILAAGLAVLLTVSGCAGSGSAESTGGTDSTGNVLAFVDPTAGTATEAPTSGTDETEATAATTSGTDGTEAPATEANSPTTGSSSVSTEATEATDAPTSPPNTEATEATTPSGSGNSGNSGSGSSGNSGNSGNSGSSGSTEATEVTTAPTNPPATEATETTDPGVVHTHSYTQTVVEPTCTEQGYTLYTCSCGYSFVSKALESMTPSLGHDWTSTTTATCTVSGVTTYTCTRCGYSYSEDVEAPGHDWVGTGAVNEYYLLYVVQCQCGERFHTYEEWDQHNRDLVLSAIGTEEYFDLWLAHGGWNSYQEHIVTRAGSEKVCTRCGEEYFEDHTDVCKSDFQKWAEETGFIPYP